MPCRSEELKDHLEHLRSLADSDPDVETRIGDLRRTVAALEADTISAEIKLHKSAGHCFAEFQSETVHCNPCAALYLTYTITGVGRLKQGLAYQRLSLALAHQVVTGAQVVSTASNGSWKFDASKRRNTDSKFRRCTPPLPLVACLQSW